MAQFDLYVVNVAIPVLQRELHANEIELELFVGGYAFAYAAVLITGGRLGDHFGHSRVFIAGMALFGIASLACGLAPDSVYLVVFRLVQGGTAAVLVPQVLALITASIPAQERSRAISWYGVVMGVGAVAGQVLGGVLLQLASWDGGWRLIFLVNVPIAAITLLFARRVLPRTVVDGHGRLDLLGATLLTASLGLLLFPLVVGRSLGWPVWTWLLLACAAPTGIFTIVWEARVSRKGSGRPILPLELFRQGPFVVGLVISVCLFSSFFSFVFCITLVLQDGIGLTPLGAGLTFGPLGIAFAVASIGSRGFVVRFGFKVISVGTAVVAVSLAVLWLVVTHSRAETPAWALALLMALVGFGNGIAVPAVIGQVLARTDKRYAGAASGLLSTAQQFSSALGIAVIGGLFFVVLAGRHGIVPSEEALRATLACSFVLAVAAFALVPLLGADARRQS